MVRINTGCFALIVALAASAVAQTNQSAPFNLKVSSSNSSIDGRYLYTCHAGAALNALCLTTTDVTTVNPSTSTFYLNYTSYGESVNYSDTAILINNLKMAPGNSFPFVSEPMSLFYTAGSNVVAAWFQPAGLSDGVRVGFGADGLFIPTYPDDSKFQEGVFPDAMPMNSTNWHSCWTLVGSGYYYNVLAWVTGGLPRNPTCQPVKVFQVAMS